MRGFVLCFDRSSDRLVAGLWAGRLWWLAEPAGLELRIAAFRHQPAAVARRLFYRLGFVLRFGRRCPELVVT